MEKGVVWKILKTNYRALRIHERGGGLGDSRSETASQSSGEYHVVYRTRGRSTRGRVAVPSSAASQGSYFLKQGGKGKTSYQITPAEYLAQKVYVCICIYVCIYVYIYNIFIYLYT